MSQTHSINTRTLQRVVRMRVAPSISGERGKNILLPRTQGTGQTRTFLICDDVTCVTSLGSLISNLHIIISWKHTDYRLGIPFYNLGSLSLTSHSHSLTLGPLSHHLGTPCPFGSPSHILGKMCKKACHIYLCQILSIGSSSNNVRHSRKR